MAGQRHLSRHDSEPPRQGRGGTCPTPWRGNMPHLGGVGGFASIGLDLRPAALPAPGRNKKKEGKKPPLLARGRRARRADPIQPAVPVRALSLQRRRRRRTPTLPRGEKKLGGVALRIVSAKANVPPRRLRGPTAHATWRRSGGSTKHARTPDPRDRS